MTKPLADYRKSAPLEPVLLGGEVIGELPSEFGELLQAIEKSKYMLAWENDWDGEGSEKFEARTWKKAVGFLVSHAAWMRQTFRQIIPTPMILHGPSGSIDIYWKYEDFHLLLNIPKNDHLPATFYGDDYHSQTVEGKFNPQDFKSILLLPALTTLQHERTATLPFPPGGRNSRPGLPVLQGSQAQRPR